MPKNPQSLALVFSLHTVWSIILQFPLSAHKGYWIKLIDPPHVVYVHGSLVPQLLLEKQTHPW
jgi:hypothetical protein